MQFIQNNSDDKSATDQDAHIIGFLLVNNIRPKQAFDVLPD